MDNYAINKIDNLQDNDLLKMYSIYASNVEIKTRDVYVYIIWDKTNMPLVNNTCIKIGRSVDPVGRFKSIKSIANGNNLMLYIILKCKKGINSELILHKFFKEYRGTGEWFNIDPFSAVELMIENNLLESIFESMIDPTNLNL